MMPNENMSVNVPKHRGNIKLDKGFFVIDVDHDKKDIQVQYYEAIRIKNDGKVKSGKLRMVFRGKRGIDLYRGILLHDFVVQLDHAAYLGYEIARAEHCLKKGIKFVQDEK